MNRDNMIEEIEKYDNQKDHWDILIIGGGATGLGAAVDAASRGYRTLLLEQDDFAKGTSSRSTKLIHGGLRYLQQGNVSLVIEALTERGLLCQNAPHLVHHLPFLVPIYHWWEGPFYGIGLKVYDMLAGSLGIEKSRHLSRAETLKLLPNLEPKDLRGGVIYYDGQFDDSRLAITLAKTAAHHGAVVANYVKVTRLIKKNGLIVGVKATDQETKKQYTLYARSIINATGVFSDKIRHLDNSKTKTSLAPSQGVHIVLPKTFQSKDTALLIPHTEDHRVLFLVPWHDRVLVGTTDRAVTSTPLEPHVLKEEIDFLLKHAGRYLKKDPTRKDILSVFAGLRPLSKGTKKENTASLSRDHTIFISHSGLISITGGKWTTYRKMAEDVVNQAILVGGLPKRACITHTLKLVGWQQSRARAKHSPIFNHWNLYGSESTRLKAEMRKKKSLSKPIHPHFAYLWVEVAFAIREEMARTVEDILSRRTRALLLDAQASRDIAPKIAHYLAKELGKNLRWEKQQIAAYLKVSKNYIFN